MLNALYLSPSSNEIRLAKSTAQRTSFIIDWKNLGCLFEVDISDFVYDVIRFLLRLLHVGSKFHVFCMYEVDFKGKFLLPTECNSCNLAHINWTWLRKFEVFYANKCRSIFYF